MKKAILGLLSVGAAASALAQGTVVFENAASTGAITIGPNTGPSSYAAAGSYTVALLWAPGTALGTAQGSFQTDCDLRSGGNLHRLLHGYRHYHDTGTTTAGGIGVFEVEGWTGNYANYAAAVAGGAAVGLSSEFLNGTGNPNPSRHTCTSANHWLGW